ncbi:MAG: type I-A CRISPR-associated protein Cas7/Csa2 [Thermoprotei archaeon]|nr:MAG: type I-A CRISPR-associated protein Cas7/Csa2 [Thermoprotei archaeon]
MVYVSLGLRAIVNVEALNMVESVGNVTRHRKASIVYKSDNRYVLRSVPVISGECLAHAYQWWIAELSKKRGLSLCQYCEQGEFLKHSDLNFFGNKPWEQKLKNTISAKKNAYDPHEVEKAIVANCVVEDIGGFLYPGARPVKRTSRFQVGYMVPAFDAIEKSSLEPQFHVRHSPSLVAQKGAKIQPQMIYYVEVGSAVYTLSFNIDLSGIGYTSMIRVESAVSDGERAKRIDVALDSLALMLDNKVFGAKLTRFNPVMDYDSVLVSVSEGFTFNVSPPAVENYIEETVIRAEKYREIFGGRVTLLGYKTAHKNVRDFDTIIELFNEVKNLVKGAKK